MSMASYLRPNMSVVPPLNGAAQPKKGQKEDTVTQMKSHKIVDTKRL